MWDGRSNGDKTLYEKLDDICQPANGNASLTVKRGNNADASDHWP